MSPRNYKKGNLDQKEKKLLPKYQKDHTYIFQRWSYSWFLFRIPVLITILLQSVLVSHWVLKTLFHFKKWSGMTVLPIEISEEIHLNPPSRNWSWSWCATMIKTKEKLTVLFIENRWVQSCDSRFTREADATSLIPIDFSISTKEATRPNSNFAKTLKTSYCRFALCKDTLVGTWSRLT